MRNAVTAPAELTFPRRDARKAAVIPMPAIQANALTLSVYHDLAMLRDTWLAFEDIADGTVFQTYEWLAAYQQFIGAARGEQPCVVLVCDDSGALAALFPLAVKRSGFARELTWLGGELCDYNAPLLAPGFDAFGFRALWQQIVTILQGDPRTSFDIVRLDKMPAHLRAQENPFVSHMPTRLNASGSYVTPLAETWDTFYAAKRSSSTRSRDRSKRKRLTEAGGVIAFDTPDTAEGTLRVLDTLMAQKSAVFAERGIRNIFDLPGYADFYRAVATDPRFRRIVHVSTLSVGDEVAATNLGLTFRGRYYYVLSSYTSGALNKLGPGAIHLHELMRHAIERGMRFFDFTIGDERYKLDWCDGVTPLYDYVAVMSLRGAVTAAPLQALQRLKRAIKQNPVLWNLFTKARALKARFGTDTTGGAA